MYSNKISQKVKQSELKFPAVIKSDGCVRSLSDHSHDIILVKNENALKELILENKLDIE